MTDHDGVDPIKCVPWWQKPYCDTVSVWPVTAGHYITYYLLPHLTGRNHKELYSGHLPFGLCKRKVTRAVMTKCPSVVPSLQDTIDVVSSVSEWVWVLYERKSVAGWTTGMAWLCYGSEAIWISHKVVRLGILYWQVTAQLLSSVTYTNTRTKSQPKQYQTSHLPLKPLPGPWWQESSEVCPGSLGYHGKVKEALQ